MADQANISQILAALANQRNGGTPGQQPQQSIPHSFSNSYPAANLPASTGGYSLPQPRSSGNLDLSQIKPTNSGSVSLADAIARARGIAAEKGVFDAPRGPPQRDGDPRLAGRTFQRSRTRSRSPQRPSRDNFRDNYNPYRDERRDDPRRANGSGFPRERSFSPALGRAAGVNYPQVNFRASSEEGVETIVIESGLVGLIIGRQGENLRRVEAETSTRVQFITGPEATGPKRQCKITGTREARDNAKAEIQRIIEENGNPARGNVPPERLATNNKGLSAHQPTLRAGEDATQIMVPNRTVGLIIGRGGETIRDLQERSQCHVNIVGPEKSVNGLRPINLIGTPQAATMAKDLIMEIVDSDTKSLAAHGDGPSRDAGRPQASVPGSGYNGYGNGDSYGDKLNDTITVPSEAVGMIIGKGGETIKDMQTTTGCKINVAQPAGQDFEREIGLVGSRSAIDQAKKAIMEKVYAVEEKNRPGGGGRRDEQSFSQANTVPNGYNQQAQSVAQPGAELDPYAPYGGYENYVMLWQVAFAAQQQGQQPPAQGQGPPGHGQIGPS